ITLLRRIDMPLGQIGQLLQLSAEERSAFVERYRRIDEAQYARRRSLALFLEHAVTAQGSPDGADQPGASRFEVARRTRAASAVLTSTQHTSARELPEVIRSTRSEERRVGKEWRSREAEEDAKKKAESKNSI